MSGLFDLSGRTALITGSVRGIGLAMAEGLAVAGGVFGGVLALAVDLGCRRLDDRRAGGLRLLVVIVDAGDADHHGVCVIDFCTGAQFGDDECAVFADVHLDAVIRNAEAHGEAEGIAKPIRRFDYIRIAKRWDNGRTRHRAVREHVLEHHLRLGDESHELTVFAGDARLPNLRLAAAVNGCRRGADG